MACTRPAYASHAERPGVKRAQLGQGLIRLELDFWEAATTWKRPAYDSGSQDGAWRKRAQLDQGGYRHRLWKSYEDVKRQSYDVVTGQRVRKLRSGCLMSYAAGTEKRSERSMHSNCSVKKGEAHGAPRPLVETSLVGDHRESEARSFWSIPGLGKEPPGFLANETLESLIRVSVLPLR